jgi:hypothetical protein
VRTIGGKVTPQPKDTTMVAVITLMIADATLTSISIPGWFYVILIVLALAFE